VQMPIQPASASGVYQVFQYYSHSHNLELYLREFRMRLPI